MDMEVAFLSSFGCSRSPKDSNPSGALSRRLSLEDEYEVAVMKSLDEATEKLTQATEELTKAIEELEEKNAAMEKKPVELPTEVAQLKKPNQGSSFMQPRETDRAAAIAEKIAELTAAVAQVATPPFESARGQVSTSTVRGQERRSDRHFLFLVASVSLISLLIAICFK